MAHRFPKFRHRTDEPIAHQEINHNLRIVKDELGRLNEHNIKINAFPLVTDAEADYALHLNNDYVAYNPYLSFGDGSVLGSQPAETLVPPNPYTDDRITINGSAEWVSLMSYEKSTGNSLLWVLFSFQQQVYGFDSNQGVQYAIRIDGTVIEETVVGGLDRSNDVSGPYVACSAYPFVLDMVLPVASGIHTIELVGRTARAVGTGWSAPFGINIVTMMFNREVIILTLDPDSEAVDGDTGEYDPLEEGDLINAATTSAPFDDLANDYNDIEYPGIQPEGLTGDHVPSPVLDSGYVAVGGVATSSYTTHYPGYANDTMIGSPGWDVIYDGTNYLAIYTLVDIDLTDTTIGGVLVGMDVNLIQLGVGDWFCVIALQFSDENGDWHTIGKTERYSSIESAPAGGQVGRKNLALRTLLTLDDLGGFTSVTGLRGVVSGQNRSIPEPWAVNVMLQQASLWFAAMQAGT